VLTSAIRHLVAARSASTLLAGFADRTVQVWDLRACARNAEFETVLSFGGSRLALSPDGKRCVAASWNGGKRGGVACYDCVSGCAVWHRPEIRRTQRVLYSADGQSVWCVVDDGPLQRLDGGSGETREVGRGVRDIRESEDGGERLLATQKRGFRYFFLIGQRSLFHIAPLVTGRVLDAAFTPEALCLSEGCGPTRCFDRKDGTELWRTDWEHEWVRQLWYDPRDAQLYAATSQRLLQCAPLAGEWKTMCEVAASCFASCPGLGQLVTSDGDLIDVASGVVKNQLDFPQREIEAPLDDASGR